MLIRVKRKKKNNERGSVTVEQALISIAVVGVVGVFAASMLGLVNTTMTTTTNFATQQAQQVAGGGN